jgi:hypothetical protein
LDVISEAILDVISGAILKRLHSKEIAGCRDAHSALLGVSFSQAVFRGRSSDRRRSGRYIPPRPSAPTSTCVENRIGFGVHKSFPIGRLDASEYRRRRCDRLHSRNAIVGLHVSFCFEQNRGGRCRLFIHEGRRIRKQRVLNVPFEKGQWRRRDGPSFQNLARRVRIVGAFSVSHFDSTDLTKVALSGDTDVSDWLFRGVCFSLRKRRHGIEEFRVHDPKRWISRRI